MSPLPSLLLGLALSAIFFNDSYDIIFGDSERSGLGPTVSVKRIPFLFALVAAQRFANQLAHSAVFLLSDTLRFGQYGCGQRDGNGLVHTHR
jgi:hypothetical protein